jgi:CBS domain-containing protein
MTCGIISVDPNATVLQAARLMLQHHISGLPVVDAAGKLVGVLSEGDFLRRQETGTDRRRSRWLEFLMGPGRMAADYSHSHGSKVAEVMTADVQSVDENTSLEDVVPVMRGGALVIVTRSNLMHAMVSLAHAAPPLAKGDTAIRERMLAIMQHEAWAPPATTNVVVRDGVVELWGVIIDERQREALKVAAENIPGVKAVDDHLTLVEPMSGIAIEPEPESKEEQGQEQERGARLS